MDEELGTIKVDSFDELGFRWTETEAEGERRGVTGLESPDKAISCSPPAAVAEKDAPLDLDPVAKVASSLDRRTSSLVARLGGVDLWLGMVIFLCRLGAPPAILYGCGDGLGVRPLFPLGIGDGERESCP